MTPEISAIVERARLAGQSAGAGDAAGAERERLKRIAAEFESMLLVQVLKDMRRAGSWDEESGGDALGAESLFETIDVELASHLARVKGLGLSDQLLQAFDRMQPHAEILAAETRSRGADTSHVSTSRRLRGSSEAAPTANPVVAAVETAVEATMAAPKAVAHLVKPVAGAVTSAFGWRRDPFTKAMKFHQGVDLKAAYGQDVQAAAAGRVVFSGDQGAYGTTVLVEHQDGTKTRYAHLSARLVQKGDQVAAGEPLGRAGKSGRATGTHLHFEVIAPDGRRVAPDQWADGNPALVTGRRSIQVRAADAD